MLYIYSAQVKDGKLKAYQAWIRENHEAIVKASPHGWKFRGVFFPVFGFGDFLSEIHWEVSSYSAFDNALSEYEKGSPYKALVDEWFSYLDARHQQGRLLKPAEADKTFVSAL